MDKFYAEQLVQIMEDLSAKTLKRSIVNAIGIIICRRDFLGIECYDVDIDSYDRACYMYADHLQALPPFKYNFNKVKEIAT